MTFFKGPQPGFAPGGSDTMNTTLERTSPIREPLPSFHYNPAVRVKINCGCGAIYRTLDEGAQHSRSTGHTLHVTGEIRSK